VKYKTDGHRITTEIKKAIDATHKAGDGLLVYRLFKIKGIIKLPAPPGEEGNK